MWQDIVIALVGLSFGFMLLPQLRDVIHGKYIIPVLLLNSMQSFLVDL